MKKSLLLLRKTIFQKAFFIIGSSIILVKVASFIHDCKDNGSIAPEKAAAGIVAVAEDDSFPSGCDGDCANCKICCSNL